MKIDDLKRLKPEDLSYQEREVYESWLRTLETKQLTLEDFRAGITRMKDGVAEELSNLTDKDERNTFLKARLKNYILMEKVLNAPKIAREALEKALEKVEIKGKPTLG